MEELWIAKKNDDGGGREKKRTKVEFERVDVFDVSRRWIERGKMIEFD